MRKNAYPQFSFTLHVTRNCYTSSFDLITLEVPTFERLDCVVSEGNRVAATCIAANGFSSTCGIWYVMELSWMTQIMNLLFFLFEDQHLTPIIPYTVLASDVP